MAVVGHILDEKVNKAQRAMIGAARPADEFWAKRNSTMAPERDKEPAKKNQEPRIALPRLQ
jgi:hypothetical protein